MTASNEIAAYLQAARAPRACCASSPAAAWTTARAPSSAACLHDTKLLSRRPVGRAREGQQAPRHQGEDIDFALLVDGLAAEREQGITIDVAYRYFSTEKRKFIVADTPGPRAVHAQHGHRRLHRRPGRGAGGCAQGPADADPAPQLHRLAAGHPPRGAGGQQDGPGGLRPGRVRCHRRRLSRTRRAAGHRRRAGDPAVGAQGRQHAPPPPTRPPGTRALRCSSTWKPWTCRPTPATPPLRMPVQWV